MKTFPVIISFYTEKTPYEEEVQNLITSCKTFDLPYVIDGVPDQGTWELNCAYKPFFIREKLQKLQKPLLWVDADGVFKKAPSWQTAFAADLAVRINADLSKDHPSKVITSTLSVQPTLAANNLLRLWIEECHKQLSDPLRTEEFWDQIALRDALLREPSATIASMPLTYTKIFDHPTDCILAQDPVIEHFQASRRFK